MIENKYGVTEITIRGEAKCYCPLGKDWYTNKFKVKLAPASVIPDYCDIDKYIAENINGKELIIEGAVAMLYEYLADTYKPHYLAVKSEVTDATHCDVIVERAAWENN